MAEAAATLPATDFYLKTVGAYIDEWSVTDDYVSRAYTGIRVVSDILAGRFWMWRLLGIRAQVCSRSQSGRSTIPCAYLRALVLQCEIDFLSSVSFQSDPRMFGAQVREYYRGKSPRPSVLNVHLSSIVHRSFKESQ